MKIEINKINLDTKADKVIDNLTVLDFDNFIDGKSGDIIYNIEHLHGASDENMNDELLLFAIACRRLIIKLRQKR